MDEAQEAPVRIGGAPADVPAQVTRSARPPGRIAAGSFVGPPGEMTKEPSEAQGRVSMRRERPREVRLGSDSDAAKGPNIPGRE